jgi:hypothetical protein
LGDGESRKTVFWKKEYSMSKEKGFSFVAEQVVHEVQPDAQ